MAEIDRERALVFGEVADLYEATRPEYPPALFDDVVEWVPLAEGDAVLESGPGTGKATREWLARGLRVVAVEPSTQMAEVGKRQAPGATWVESTFETFDPGAARFSLVAAAQSWHWVDPDVGYRIAARLLRRTGALATFWNLPWFPHGRHEAIDAAYERHVPGLDKFENPDERLARGIAAFAGSGVFPEPESRQYRWAVDYTAAGWTALMMTHSDHRMLEPATREALLTDVAAAIERSGGAIEVDYVTNLLMARPLR